MSAPSFAERSRKRAERIRSDITSLAITGMLASCRYEIEVSGYTYALLLVSVLRYVEDILTLQGVGKVCGSVTLM